LEVRVAGRWVEHQLGGIRIAGYSVAGEETVVAAPELNVCFDVGNAPAQMLAIDHVLLSHGHMDHAAGLAYYFSQRNFVGNAAGCVLLPTPLVGPIRELVRVWGLIEGHVSPAKIVGLSPGDRYELRRGLFAQAFAVNHRAPALGYAVVESRHKLKPELADRSGPQLVELKKQGVQIEDRIEVPLVAFCGDTAEGDWLAEPVVRQARVLIVECTFFDSDHVRRAREGYHMHVRDVARILPKLENPHFVLHHVSRRTSIRDARRILSSLVADEVMSRVTFLMDARRSRSPDDRASADVELQSPSSKPAPGP
jgi:ribonuclease Z